METQLFLYLVSKLQDSCQNCISTIGFNNIVAVKDGGGCCHVYLVYILGTSVQAVSRIWVLMESHQFGVTFQIHLYARFVSISYRFLKKWMPTCDRAHSLRENTSQKQLWVSEAANRDGVGTLGVPPSLIYSLQSCFVIV